MIHPRSGYPIYSHQACFIDFSSYEGSQNVRMVRQKGHVAPRARTNWRFIPDAWAPAAIARDRAILFPKRK